MARKWSDSHLGTGVRATMNDISKEVEDLGLPAVNKSANLRHYHPLSYLHCVLAFVY